MSSSDRMSISYLCASSEPPADDAMTMDTLRKMQAEFNRNKRRSVREKSVVTTILKDRDNSDPSDDEECEPRKAAYVYDAVDPITGHVLVNGKWMPYVTLRWNCRELRDKDKLISSVKALMKVPITPEQDAKERTPVNTICSIVPCHVIPRLDDGTAAGKYVRVVYRLKGRNIRGMTTLEVLSKGYVSKPQERLKLKEFVTAEFEKIAKAGRNQAQLISIMGLTVQHDDFMPVKTGYKFKHFNFGKIMQCVDTDLETEIAQFLANVSKADDLIPPRPAPESDVMNRTSALLAAAEMLAVECSEKADATKKAANAGAAGEKSAVKASDAESIAEKAAGRKKRKAEKVLVIPSPVLLSDDEDAVVKKKRVSWAV